MLGVAVGAVLGLLFAPSPGEKTRAKVARAVRDLRELAEENADGLRDLLAAEDEGPDVEDEGAAERPSARIEVRQRLAAARQRRRGARTARGGGDTGEGEDAPRA
jgi:gas vesicle protein